MFNFESEFRRFTMASSCPYFNLERMTAVNYYGIRISGSRMSSGPGLDRSDSVAEETE
jgi:hypothetical protein